MADRGASRHRLSHDARVLVILYVVIFIGFIGYHLMITTFTPMFLDARSGNCRLRARRRIEPSCSDSSFASIHWASS